MGDRPRRLPTLGAIIAVAIGIAFVVLIVLLHLAGGIGPGAH